MLCSGWITVMIVINAMILTHSSVNGKPIKEMRATHSSSPSQVILDRHSEENSIRHSRGRSNRRSKHSFKCRKKLDLKHVIIKFKNVIDRYDSEWREVKSLYAPVEPCVPDKCGETQHLIPAHLLPRTFKCGKVKSCKQLKKKILKALSRFHAGVRYFAERFQNLTVTHQEQGRNINRSRLRLLNKFKNDLEMLNRETESLMTKKRLKNFPRRKSLRAIISSSEISKIYQTDLLINERLTIQHSKNFLAAWMGWMNGWKAQKCVQMLVGNETELRERFFSKISPC